MQVQEAQRVPNKMDAEVHSKTYHNYKPKVKDKEGTLKEAREKQLVTYKEASKRPSADFSTETLQATTVWQEYSK